MTRMTSQFAEELLAASRSLPSGAKLDIRAVDWDDYESLLAKLADSPRLRVSYDRGWLQVVSPLPEHERFARFIDSLVRAYADARGLEVEMLGQTTWRRRALGKGAEADCCYYVGNAAFIIGKTRIDLESDPPPDIVVEIDTTRASANKFSIYAALAVPEVWLYNGQHVRFFALSGERYLETVTSHALPGLNPEKLTEALDVAKTHGQTAALAVFRRQ